ncbi:MAG: AGE family epimerase/isomerase [Bacteroidota bacterium]
MKKCLLYFCFPLLLIYCISCQEKETTPSLMEGISAQIEHVLVEEMAPAWYPRVLDTVDGGYLSNFDYQWKPFGGQNKMIVTQARHVWTTSKLAEAGVQRDYFSTIAVHGVDYLRETMWDSENGGFYTLVDKKGTPIDFDGKGKILKHAYGNSFAIYGLSAYVKLTTDTSALDLAKEAFHWLETHSHDSVRKGYYQFMEPDGTPLPEGFNDVPPKDQNSSIHLLEAFTELYQVWPDPLVKERLEEMLILIRDEITHEDGYLRLFFSEEWEPFVYEDSSLESLEQNSYLDHVSFGHDIETAYLLMEASEVLYGEMDSLTMARAKIMTDHSLNQGFDASVGGLFDRGYYLGGKMHIIKDTKEWWGQAETLNTLLIMSQLYPEDPMAYEKKFIQQWQYIDKYLLDHEHGGWYIGGIDKEEGAKKAIKSGIWKGAYHTVRSMLNCLHRIDKPHE